MCYRSDAGVPARVGPISEATGGQQEPLHVRQFLLAMGIFENRDDPVIADPMLLRLLQRLQDA
jgi:hypothetical protein